MTTIATSPTTTRPRGLPVAMIRATELHALRIAGRPVQEQTMLLATWFRALAAHGVESSTIERAMKEANDDNSN